MKQPVIQSSNEMYIEADSKLSAMATFLDQLRADPAARSVLHSMLDQFEAIITAGLRNIDSTPGDTTALYGAVDGLRRAIDALPVDTVADDDCWQHLRDCHRRCRRHFSLAIDGLLRQRGRRNHINADNSRSPRHTDALA